MAFLAAYRKPSSMGSKAGINFRKEQSGRGSRWGQLPKVTSPPTASLLLGRGVVPFLLKFSMVGLLRAS